MYLVGNTEDVGRHVADANDEEDEQLHIVAGRCCFNAKSLRSVIECISHPDQACAYKDDVLPRVAKLLVVLHEHRRSPPLSEQPESLSRGVTLDGIVNPSPHVPVRTYQLAKVKDYQ